MKYNIIKNIVKNNYYEENIIEQNSQLYLLRIYYSENFIDIQKYSKFEEDFKLFSNDGILLPVYINIKNTNAEIIYPFPEKDTKNNYIAITGYILKIMDYLVHNINYIPEGIDVNDFFQSSEGIFCFYPPITKNMNGEIYLNEDKNENGLIVSISDILRDFSKKIKDENFDLFYEEFKNSKFNCVSEINSLYQKYFNNKYYTLVKEPNFVGRKDYLKKIMKAIESNIRFNNFVIKGKQRSGKTELMKYIEKMYSNKPDTHVAIVSNKDQIFDMISEIAEKYSITFQDNITDKDVLIYDGLMKINEKSDKLRLIFMIDEYQESYKSYEKLINTIKNMDLNFQINFILTTHDEKIEEKININDFCTQNLDKLSVIETRMIVRSMISAGFVEENQEFIDIIYNISEGLPGNIKDIIFEMWRKNIIYYSENGWKCDIKKIKFKNYFSFIDEKFNSVNENIKYQTALLSVLGNRFSGKDIEYLEEFINSKINIQEIIKTGIIENEDDNYRFFNLIYHEKFYDYLDKNYINKIHGHLLKKYIKFEDKIRHAEKILNKKELTILYFNEIKNMFDTWKDVDMIDHYYYEMTKKGLISDSAFLIYIRKLLNSESYSKAYEYAERLRTKKWMKYYYIYVLLENDISGFLYEIEKLKNKRNKSEMEVMYYNFFMIEYLVTNNKYKKNEVENLMKKIENIYEKNKNNRKFAEVYLDSINIYSFYLSQKSRFKSVEYNQKGLNLAKKYGFIRYVVLFSINLSYDNIENNLVFNKYMSESMKIAYESKDYSKLPEIYFNYAYNNLYKGNTDEFFKNVSESIKFSNATQNERFIVSANSIKAFYYFYISDYVNMNTTLLKIMKYMDHQSDTVKRIVKRNFLLITAYYSLMKGNKESVKEVGNEIKENFGESSITQLTDIFISSGPQKIKKIFDEIMEGITDKEETVYLMYWKFTRPELRDYFIKNLEEIEKTLKVNRYNFSLAMLYEGAFKFYTEISDMVKALKYFRLAFLSYDSLNIERKKEELNDYFNNNKKKFSISQNIIYDKTISDDLNKNLIYFSSEIISMDNAQEILNRVNSFFVRYYAVKDVKIRMVSNYFEAESSTGSVIIAENDHISFEPLEISFISDHDDFVLKYYLKNDKLYINYNNFQIIYDSIILLDKYISGAIYRIIHLENSITDYLTGAYSRRYLFMRIEEEIEKYKREKTIFSVSMLDIDDFKKINDTYGHSKGDEVLKFFVEKIKENTRSFDIVSRYGGEEFVVVFPNTSDEEVYKILKRLREIIKKETEEFFGYPITASFGIAEYFKGINSENLIKNADEASYISKRSGKDTITVYRRKNEST